MSESLSKDVTKTIIITQTKREKDKASLLVSRFDHGTEEVSRALCNPILDLGHVFLGHAAALAPKETDKAVETHKRQKTNRLCVSLEERGTVHESPSHSSQRCSPPSNPPLLLKPFLPRVLARVCDVHAGVGEARGLRARAEL